MDRVGGIIQEDQIKEKNNEFAQWQILVILLVLYTEASNSIIYVT